MWVVISVVKVLSAGDALVLINYKRIQSRTTQPTLRRIMCDICRYIFTLEMCKYSKFSAISGLEYAAVCNVTTVNLSFKIIYIYIYIYAHSEL
jgi:hypothetical protein